MRTSIKRLISLMAFLVLVLLFGYLNPREVDVTESVMIDGDRDQIWTAVTDFEGVFHQSNSAHIETVVTTSPKHPFRSGLTFRQIETVGGIRGVLEGEVFDVKEKHRYQWKASTEYHLAWWSFITVQEGGEIRIAETPQGNNRLIHRVYGHFPDTVPGRILSWLACAILGMETDAASHTLTELEYVKDLVEGEKHD